MCKAGIISTFLERKGHHFYVEADMSFVFNRLSDNAMQMFTPLLFNDSHQIELPAMLIAGKRRYWTFRFAFWGLNGHVLYNYRIKKILKGINFTSVNYIYRVKLDYEDWMDKAKVNLAN